ncbi:MAG TPA: helix-turn-helix transcriptional regulator [Gemmatimonadaceae bacterium]|nr:helix-turn-helix transcriptional regulator [Gemmatimonadaceae bacterium]
MKQSSGGQGGDTTLYNRLAVLRAERSMSRQQLAEQLGVNYQTIGYLERGEYNPSLELAFRISALFAVPIEAVFSRTPFAPLSQVVYQRPDVSGIAGGNS